MTFIMGRCYIAQERIATLRRLLPNAEAFVAAAVAGRPTAEEVEEGDGGATSIAAAAARVLVAVAASGSGSIVGATAAACGGGCSSGGGGEMADEPSQTGRASTTVAQHAADLLRYTVSGGRAAASGYCSATRQQQALQLPRSRARQQAAAQQAAAAVAEQEVKHQQLRMQGELRRMDEAGLPMARMIPPGD